MSVSAKPVLTKIFLLNWWTNKILSIGPSEGALLRPDEVDGR